VSKKIDLNYLKKNLNLEVFIKSLNKTKSLKLGNSEEFVYLYYDFFDACAKKESEELVLDGSYLSGILSIDLKFQDKIIKSYSNGSFLPTISNNFKLVKKKEIFQTLIYENTYQRIVQSYQVVFSKINKIYYILFYRGTFPIVKSFKAATAQRGVGSGLKNVSYFFVHKKFKDKKKALNAIKKVKYKKWITSSADEYED